MPISSFIMKLFKQMPRFPKVFLIFKFRIEQKPYLVYPPSFWINLSYCPQNETYSYYGLRHQEEISLVSND